MERGRLSAQESLPAVVQPSYENMQIWFASMKTTAWIEMHPRYSEDSTSFSRITSPSRFGSGTSVREQVVHYFGCRLMGRDICKNAARLIKGEISNSRS